MDVPFVDLGLCLGRSEHLGSESLPLLKAVISCARFDPVLWRCFSESLTFSAFGGLHKVFGNPEVIDANSLSGCVGPMASFLTLPFLVAVCTALFCFVSMTNKMPSLVFTLYEMELSPMIVKMLTDDSLVAAAGEGLVGL
jgi:hypothetical protein